MGKHLLSEIRLNVDEHSVDVITRGESDAFGEKVVTFEAQEELMDDTDVQYVSAGRRPNHGDGRDAFERGMAKRAPYLKIRVICGKSDLKRGSDRHITARCQAGHC